jgi:glucokinase
VVEEAVARLGGVLAALVNALDPGAIVVGGGLGLDDGYRGRFVAAMRAAIYDPEARELPVLTAALGAFAPAVGAALAACA